VPGGQACAGGGAEEGAGKTTAWSIPCSLPHSPLKGHSVESAAFPMLCARVVSRHRQHGELAQHTTEQHTKECSTPPTE
jgi:hypothetical protein